MTHVPVVDAHVHFWDPAELSYPWLKGVPVLDRAFLPPEYARATSDVPVERMIFVEGNCLPNESAQEVDFAHRLARAGACIGAAIAFVNLVDEESRGGALDALTSRAMVRGVRQNVQGQPAGWALQRQFVNGVREVGRRGFTFDLCATHDQLGDVVELVRRCPDVRFVLDHCGKPAIRNGRMEPWRAEITRLAAYEQVVACKLSGLLTESEVARGSDADLVPYAEHVVASFGTDRVVYGSDWPVLTVAGEYADWYGFTERFTADWSATERAGFYHDNAVRVYGLSFSLESSEMERIDT